MLMNKEYNILAYHDTIMRKKNYLSGNVKMTADVIYLYVDNACSDMYAYRKLVYFFAKSSKNQKQNKFSLRNENYVIN